MEGLNACAECGYTTTDFAEFAAHIERHEEKNAAPDPCWSGENSPSTSPRGSTDSGISSSAVTEEFSPSGSDVKKANSLMCDETQSLFSPQTLAQNMFASGHPFSLNMMAAAMAAASVGGDKLPLLNGTAQGAEATANLSESFSQTPLPGQSPPAPEKATASTGTEEREVRKSGKTEKVMHSCPHCNFTTVMSQHMKSHLEAHERHQGQMYQCDICQMQFSQKANMHRHRMRHSGVKPYQCRFCLKKFFRKDQMQEHSMTHIKTGDDFDCPVAGCTRQFSQHSALRGHLEDQHVISATSQASCKRCSLLFSQPRRLLLHYQTKHEYVDPVLKRSFKEDSTALGNLTGIDLNAAMQMFTASATSPMADRKPPLKRRRPSKRCGIEQLSAPTSLSTSPSQATAAFAATIASLTESQMPLDMTRRSTPVNVSTPPASQNTGSRAPSPKSEEDPIIDVCGTDSAPEDKKEAVSTGNLPKADNQDYEQAIANGYKLGNLRPEFMFGNNCFSSFLMPPKPEALLWTPDAHVATTITSFPSSGVSSSGGDELSASTTHSPSGESRSSTGSVDKEPLECGHCGIVFLDRTLHLLHKGLHSAQDPWKCNLCGAMCYDKYVFTSHMISSDHT